MGQPIVQLLMLACGETEVIVMAPPPTCDSAVLPCFRGCLAFLHRDFPPQSPPSHPLYLSLRSQQQPSPWDCSTIPNLQLPIAVLYRGPTSLSGDIAVAKTVWFSLHLGCHRSAVSVSALSVSRLTQTVVPMWGWNPWFSSSTLCGQVQSYKHSLVFSLVPSSYRVLCGSIYSFPLVVYSCPLSAGVLHALPCLKVCSWCIRGERCTPCPPSSPPSCYPHFCFYKKLNMSS